MGKQSEFVFNEVIAMRTDMPCANINRRTLIGLRAHRSGGWLGNKTGFKMTYDVFVGNNSVGSVQAPDANSAFAYAKSLYADKRNITQTEYVNLSLQERGQNQRVSHDLLIDPIEPPCRPNHSHQGTNCTNHQLHTSDICSLCGVSRTDTQGYPFSLGGEVHKRTFAQIQIATAECLQ